MASKTLKVAVDVSQAATGAISQVLDECVASGMSKEMTVHTLRAALRAIEEVAKGYSPPEPTIDGVPTWVPVSGNLEPMTTAEGLAYSQIIGEMIANEIVSPVKGSNGYRMAMRDRVYEVAIQVKAVNP